MRQHTDRAIANSPTFACPDLDEDFSMQDDSPYCLKLPSQLKYWDATALRRFMECPRKYQLMQVGGWNKRGSLDLEFGLLYHEACERFDKLILKGTEHAVAVWDTFSYFVRREDIAERLATAYYPVWRCTSPAEVIGPRSGRPKRNTDRCQRARTVQFDGGHHSGEACPDCGLPTTDDWEMICENANKNRDTLLRTILFYCDSALESTVQPYAFPDGEAAVELSFAIPLPLESPDGDPYVLTGNIDGLGDFAGEILPRERKTTKNTPELWFFDRYNPDVQVDVYDLAANVMYADLLDPKPQGVLMEVTQVTKTISRIERQIVNVPEERRAETLQDILAHIKEAERCARDGYYPKRTASCNVNGGCPMRKICRLAPSSRAGFLPGLDYEKREWNPREIR